MRPIPISFFGSADTIDPNDFITVWDVTAGDTVQLRQNASYTASINYDVDWGDGTVETGITDPNKTHTYAATGVYDVKVSGSFPALYLGVTTGANRGRLVELKQWGVTSVLSLYKAFQNCANMVYSATDAPDLSSISTTTSNLFRQAFEGCNAIIDLDLSGWSNVGHAGSYGLYRMFYNSVNLETINLTGWDVTTATNSYNVFQKVGYSTASGCRILAPNLDWASNNDIRGMFQDTFFNSFDISNWKLSPSTAIDAGSLFLQAKFNSPTALDLSSWANTGSINDLRQAFRGPVSGGSNITSLNMTGWDTTNVTDMSYFCYLQKDMTALIGLGGFKADNLTDLKGAFWSCHSIDFTTHNFNDLLWGNVIQLVGNNEYMFRECCLTSPGPAPNIQPWDISLVTSLKGCFLSAKFTTAVNIDSWDFTSVTTMNDMFRDSTGTTSVTFNNITSSVTSFYALFYLNPDITTIIYDNSCDLSGITTWQFYAQDASSLTTFTIPALASFAGTTVMSSAFGGSSAPPLSIASYDLLLRRLDSTLINTITLTATLASWTCGSAAATAHANLIAAGNTLSDTGSCT